MPSFPPPTTVLTLDWKKAFFAAEARLSPRLEQLVRTDAVLDALAVANGASRLARRLAGQLGCGLVERAGLPSHRQLRQLQQSVDALRTGTGTS